MRPQPGRDHGAGQARGGRQTPDGAAALRVRGAAAATPTACALTAPGGRGRPCPQVQPPVPPRPSAAGVPDLRPEPPLSASARTTCRAAPPGSRPEAGGGSSRSRGDEGFTGEWAPRRRCRCSRSPARSAHAPGPCPDPHRSPPSWLEAEEPARRAPVRTAGASGTRREREGAGRGGSAQARRPAREQALTLARGHRAAWDGEERRRVASRSARPRAPVAVL